MDKLQNKNYGKRRLKNKSAGLSVREELRANILKIFADLIGSYGIAEGEDIAAMLNSCVLARKVIESFTVPEREKKKIFKRVIANYLEWRECALPKADITAVAGGSQEAINKRSPENKA